MSEHQRVAFRAIDGPVSEKNLEFMRRQSSRVSRAIVSASSHASTANVRAMGSPTSSLESEKRRGSSAVTWIWAVPEVEMSALDVGALNGPTTSESCTR